MQQFKLFTVLVGAMVALIFGTMGLSAIDRWWNYEQVTAEVLASDETCQTEVKRNYVVVRTRRTSKWRDCRDGEEVGKTGKSQWTYARQAIRLRYRSPADGKVRISTLAETGRNEGADRAIVGRKWEILAHKTKPLLIQKL